MTRRPGIEPGPTNSRTVVLYTTPRCTCSWVDTFFLSGDEMKDEQRRATLMRWQEKWDKVDKGRWTYGLIPHLDKWINGRHGSVNYYLTQMLSGRGCFRAYLYKFKYKNSPECPTCSGLEENAEHVSIASPTVNAHHCELEATVEQNIKPETLVEVMLCSNEA